MSSIKRFRMRCPPDKRHGFYQTREEIRERQRNPSCAIDCADANREQMLKVYSKAEFT